MDRAEKAVELNNSGNNCCQAVLLAFADRLSIDENVLKKLGTGFGSGMGCLEATCGALCGAQMVLGLAKFSDKPLNKEARKVLCSFKESCGSVNCGELKGVKTGKALCSCENCVRNAVLALEETGVL